VKPQLSRAPIAAYAIAPHAPAAVAEAHATFDKLGLKWAEVLGEVRDAKEAVLEAKAADILAAAVAYEAGEEPKALGELEQAANAKLKTLEDRVAGLSKAVDEAGNKLAYLIAEHSADYRASLEEALIEIGARYDQAVAVARQELAEFKPLRSGIEWLDRFDAGQATIGQSGQFAGGRLMVRGKGVAGVISGELDPADLLKLAATATAEPAPPPVRTMTPGERASLDKAAALA
jgi:hypothetical protein